MSAWLIPIVVGVAGAVPAFYIGRRLAGNAAGFCAAVAVSLNPIVLERTVSGDNDIWNVVIPLFMVWAILAAASARDWWWQVGFAGLAAGFVWLHAMTWRGWILFFLSW